MAERTVMVRLRANADQFSREMVRAEAAVKGVRDEIDTTNDRTAWLAQGFLALAPTIAPLGAAVVPVLSGIATQATVGAAALGTMALAFTGVGDALGAVNKYQLDPTKANLEAMQRSLEKIGPEGAAFVGFLDQVGSQLSVLQTDARAGMFPGMMEGIDAFMARLPQLREIVQSLAQGIGILSDEAGRGLASDEFDAFFEYLRTDAQPILLDMGRTIGNFADGLTTMLVAFDPLSKGFSHGLLDMSRSFEQWAEGLDESASFQEFLDYVQQSGPKALDLFGSLVDLLVELGKAAAPIGDVALPILTHLVDALAAIADTPVGQFAIVGAALTSLYGRMKALGEIAGGGVMGTMFAPSKASVAAAKANLGSLSGSLSTMTATWVTAGARTEREAARMTAAQDELRKGVTSTAKAFGPAAGQAALFATAMSPLPDKLGLSGTVMGAMIGSTIGPWGTAIGAAAGFAMDLAHANDDANASLDRLEKTARTTDFARYTREAADAMSKLADYQDDVELGRGENINLFDPDYWKSIKNGLEGAFGESDVDELQSKADRASEAARTTEGAFVSLGRALGDKPKNSAAGYLDSATQAATTAAPAMSALGISVESYAAAYKRIPKDGGRSFEALTDQIREQMRYLDSGPGRMATYRSALDDLGSDAGTAADQAAALTSALEALFGPKLNLEEATDKWRTALKQLRKELDANAGFAGNSDGAINNRALSRDYMSIVSDRLGKLVEAKQFDRIPKAILEARDAFIKEGVAAGFSAERMRDRANAIGLTPKLVVTTLRDIGWDEARIKAWQAKQAFDSLPKDVRAKIHADGIPQTMAQVDALVHKYGLTEKERRALIRLMDHASPTIQAILAALRNVKDKTVTVTTVFRRKGAPSTTGTSGRSRNDVGTNDADGGFHVDGVKQFADGGYGVDGRYYARTPQIVAGGANILWGEEETGWEAYISGKPGMRERNIAILQEAARRLGASVTGFADGGHAGSSGGRAPAWYAAQFGVDIDKNDSLKKRLRLFEKALDDARTELDKERSARQALTSSISDQLGGDIFTRDGSGSVWNEAFASGSLQAANAKLRQQGADAREFAHLEKVLGKRGLKGAAFEALIQQGGLEGLRSAAASSASDIRTYQSLFGQRNAAIKSAANTGSRVLGYTAGEKATVAQLHAIEKTVKQLDRKLDHRSKAAKHEREKNAQRTGAEVGKAINKGSANASRRKPRGRMP
ncbi:MAG TPA: hypothetical protein VNS81_00200 [Nocardioides sp.]|nr:hypothetical protein [Nocardioides sp.]